MFHTMLVPLDGSRFAEAALPLASQLARSAKAKLQLVHVHEPMAAVIGPGDMVLPPPYLDEELQAREESYLAEIAADLRPACTVPVGLREIAGAAGPEICEEAARIDADLLIMATHGRGALRRLWLGSVADYVVRHLGVPILLVHPDRAGQAPSVPAARGILVALDFSQDAETILEPVTAFAQLTQAHVTLIHTMGTFQEMGAPALPFPMPQDPALLESYRVQAQRKLDEVADRLRARGLSVATRITAGVSTAGTLLDALEEARFDLIAMTTHGAGGMRRLLLGSVADKVIRGAVKPVLVLRPSPTV